MIKPMWQRADRLSGVNLWCGSGPAVPAPESLFQVRLRVPVFPRSDAITKPVDLTFSFGRRMWSRALCRTLIHLRDVYIPPPWSPDLPHKRCRADIVHPPCGPLAFSPSS